MSNTSQINVVVAQTQQGNAIAQTTQQLNTLQQTAAKTNTSAATAQAGAHVQKAVAQARRAHAAHSGILQMVGDLLDQLTGHQGWVFRLRGMAQTVNMMKAAGAGAAGGAASGAGTVAAGGLMARLLPLLANPIGLAIAATTAAAGGGYLAYKSARIGQEDRDIAMHNRLREARLAERDKDEQMQQYSTDAGGMFHASLEKDLEVKKLKRHRKTLEDEARSGVMGRLAESVGSEFFTKGKWGFKPKSAQALEEHDEAEKDAENESADEKRRAAEMYQKFEQPQIDAQKKINEGHMEEARVIQDKATRLKEEYRLKNLGATDAQAKEGAGVKMAGVARERAGDYAKLVNARSGAGDIARIATLAHDERMRTFTSGIAAMHGDMNRNFEMQHEAQTRKEFSRR